MKIFSRGRIERAERDVLAKKLMHKESIKEPYALATSMIKKGYKVSDKSAVQKEFKAQKEEKAKSKGLTNPEGLQLSNNFYAQVTLIIGKRGSGKSHTAGVIAEEQYFKGIQFVFIDTQNANNGLLKLENVKKASTQDNPVSLAIELINSGQSCEIINNVDLDKLQKWVKDFLNIFVEKSRKGIKTIYIDEIHLLCPNHKVVESSAVIKRLVTTKRSDGMGIVMITQRPALVDTTIINQADNIFIHKVTGLRDLEILKDLLGYELIDNSQIKETLINVRNFEVGQCLIISEELSKRNQ